MRIMGGSMAILVKKAVWLAALCLFMRQGLVQAQTSNLAYQVANMVEDMRILDEAIRSMRVELESMRRENGQLREQVSEYQNRIGSSMDQLATIGQVNSAVSKAVSALELRDEKMKNEIILKVNQEITDFANSVKKSIGGMPAASAKPDPTLRTSFPRNFPETGSPYIVRGGDTLSSIAKKFGSTVDWVQNANEIASPRHLQAGRKLFIPHN
jgi:LysM repeat protein